MVPTHWFFFTVIRNSREDDEIHDINNELEQEYPVGKSIPFVFEQFIKWLDLEHLETILKQEATASPTLFRISVPSAGLSIKDTLFINQSSEEWINNAQ